MSGPLLSVCIPTFNRAPYLDRLLRRIFLEAGEIIDQIEVIVSNNASTDETYDVCETLQKKFGPNLKIFHQSSNIGSAANLNFIYSKATGRYCVYLADDDILFWPKLLDALELLLNNPEAVALFAPWVLVDLRDETILDQFYEHPNCEIFSVDTKIEMVSFILSYRIFSEIFIIKKETLNTISIIISDVAFWAFTFPSALINFGQIIYSPEPFYGSVTNHFELPDRTQAGVEDVMVAWDRYRGGLEHLLGTVRGELQDFDLRAAQTQIDDLIKNRMLIALRLRLAKQMDKLESYFLASRLRGLGCLDELPLNFSFIRTEAAIFYLSRDIAQKYDVSTLVLLGSWNETEVAHIRRLSLIEVRLFNENCFDLLPYIVLFKDDKSKNEYKHIADNASFSITVASLLRIFP